MTMLERSPSPHRRARLVAVVRRVLNWPARVAEARRTLAFLGQMTDRELGDIGLLRSDLADCAALPLDEDPSHKLARLRAARAWFAPGRRDRSPGGAPPIFDEQAEGRSPTDLRLPAARQGYADGVDRGFGGAGIDNGGAGTKLAGA
jgi:uncharacterized protein YjiS (DUF1127 family)